MHTKISQYEITGELYESRRTLVCRGYRLVDGVPVVLKILKPDAATECELARFRRVFNITSMIDLPGVVKTYGLEEYQGSLMMVLEDIGGESLDRSCEQAPFPLAQFLELAIGLADTLASLHQLRITHKDINPAHIVRNRETGQFQLIDFGIADDLSQCDVALQPPSALEGTLAYISPEQTGRMNRAVDYRTDFYSLGITFYRLLTGKMPFEADDALGMVHWHIAGTAAAPHALDRNIPEVISRIVMKLMAKMAEDRYQSGRGLKADLERCLAGLTGVGGIRDFELGLADVSDRLQMPRKLYGREKEVVRLLETFERVGSGGCELLLVAGSAGVGKTTLVHETHKPVLEKGGFFIEGKFDQSQRNVPYSGWILAFEGFVNYLLMESEAALAQWKQDILKTVRNSGRVLTDVIPHLELIIGTQPPVPEWGGTEVQNRFNYLFLELVKAIATSEHPLVVFLDDLQWIDAASLRLLETLLSSRVSSVLVLGAYRDNEVDAFHPLTKSIEALRKEGLNIDQMTLGNLSEETVNELVADTLHCELLQTIPLSHLIHAKTGGNAFFTLQMLRVLAQRQAISFDAGKLCWQWDISALESMEITDNIVTLMLGKIQKLAPETRDILSLAACMGFRCNLSNLSTIAQQSVEVTLESLQPALAEGLIISSDGNCQFVHDRVQQAAYLLIPDADKKKAHLEIGKLLLRRLPEQGQAEQLLTIVDHLNMGAELLETTDEKLELAELNLRAGSKAKASAAYSAAARYFDAGVALLGDKSWDSRYTLALELHTLAAETASLTGNFERTDHLFAAITRNARTAVHMVGAYESKMHCYVSQGKLQEVLDIALEILEKLGLSLPSHPTAEDIRRGMEETKSLYAGMPIEALISLPEMTDSSKLAIVHVASKASAAAYIGRSTLNHLLIINEVNLSIRYGNAIASPYSYACYALLLCGADNDFDAGYRFGNLSVALLEATNNLLFRSKVLEVVNGHVWHFKQHLRTTLPQLEAGYQSGLEAGDLEYAGYNAFFYCCHSYFAGVDLRQLVQTIASYHEGLRRIWAETALRCLGPFWQAALNLSGMSDDPCLLVGKGFDQEKMLPILEQTQNSAAMAALHVNRLLLCYLFEDYPQALESAELAEKNKGGMLGMFSLSVLIFYDSLTRLQMYPGADAIEQVRLLAKVSDNQRELKLLADNAPMNHRHRFYLVEAERLRVTGESLAALDCYDSAISLAKENGYVQEEALANELAARFWLVMGKEHVARIYLARARGCYESWGAARKVQDLDERYSALLAVKPDEETVRTSSELLDLATVMKATHAISAEIELNKLLAEMMRIVIENAGAQRGFLFLEREGAWTVAAKGELGAAEVEIQLRVSMDEADLVSPAVVRFVARTKERVVLDDAASQGAFADDPRIRREKTKSLLCTPLLSRGRLIGVLYLENNLTTGAFTQEKVRLLEMLRSQAAISLENARIYEALRESEAKYRRIVDTATEGIWMIGPDIRTTFVNTRMAEMLGYSAEEMNGRPVTDFIFEEDAPDYQRNIETLRRGLSENFERRYRRKNGETVWTLASATPIFDDEHVYQGAFGMFTDITQKKLAEAELRRLTEDLERMVEERTAELAAKNAELERMNRLFVGRELRMVELKERIRKLEQHDRPQGEKDTGSVE